MNAFLAAVAGPIAASDAAIWAAIAPLLVISFGIVIWALVDLTRFQARGLPKWAWAIICLVSIPFGAIVFLIVGRDRDARPPVRDP